MARPWIALYSQTGSEILTLSRLLGRVPDEIITNTQREVDPAFNDLSYRLFVRGQHKDLMAYLRTAYGSNPIVTLHGYLRIIPEDICFNMDVYNGHPGLITQYPELKGKDPQEKVWISRERYDIIGSVIHKVSRDLDGGPIIAEASATYGDKGSKVVLYNQLRCLSLTTWLNFFGNELYENRDNRSTFHRQNNPPECS